MNEALLLDTLAVAVPLEIGKLADAGEDRRAALAEELRMTEPAGAPGTRERRLELSRLAGRPDGGYPLGAADDMLYGGKKCAAGFAALAQALAVLAYAPGGVRIGTLAWCAAHLRQHWPDAGPCPTCLREETEA